MATERGHEQKLYWNDADGNSPMLGFIVEYSGSPILPGDANGDGVVDLTDFGILKANFGAGTARAQGDFNADGAVDLTDFGVLKDNFGKSGADSALQPTVQASEPSTGLLSLLAGATVTAVARWRRKKEGP